MATEVNLPALGESVTEGTVTQWLKSVGDDVAVDEPLLEVSTDKVDTEIPSPVAGKLLEIKAAEDETVEVGAVLAVIGEEGESSGDAGGSDQSTEAEPPRHPPRRTSQHKHPLKRISQARHQPMRLPTKAAPRRHRPSRHPRLKQGRHLQMATRRTSPSQSSERASPKAP